MEYSYQRPFLKWAGGKFALLPDLLQLLPPGDRLVEPFVGSGVVFLNGKYPRNLVADQNAHVIGLYHWVKKDVHALLTEVESLFTPANNNRQAFDRLRAEFNASSESTLRHAALVVYLNKFAFNGLFRVNSTGKFNVPFGRYDRPTVPREEILNFHRVAQHTTFRRADFEDTLNECRPGDVVYLDPPYEPLTETANFTSYGALKFGRPEQERLAEAARKLACRGIPVVVSNHDTPFIRTLYKGARRHYLTVRRFISCDGSNRASAPEVIAVFDGHYARRYSPEKSSRTLSAA